MPRVTHQQQLLRMQVMLIQHIETSGFHASPTTAAVVLEMCRRRKRPSVAYVQPDTRRVFREKSMVA